MTRTKTISDEELLTVARAVFREQGRTASTRAIARRAGISEGVLYQRFGSKEDLFFAAVAPRAPDIEALLGPEPPVEDAPTFLKSVLLRTAKHFGEVIPLALQIITHPSARGAGREHVQAGLAQLQKGLTSRLVWFENQSMRAGTAERAAQMLVSLAHDFALGHSGIHPGGGHGVHELEEMAELVWNGIARVGETRRERSG
jgi:AcrR family transcriptional regulator